MAELTAMDAAEQARDLAEELVGDVDGVSGVDRDDDGWSVTVEVVEVERIPPTTDVIASYELRLDSEGELVSYRRKARYHRSDRLEELR